MYVHADHRRLVLFGRVGVYADLGLCIAPFVRLVDWHGDVSTMADGIHPDVQGIMTLGRMLGTEYKKHLKFDAGAAAPLVSTTIS